MNHTNSTSAVVYDDDVLVISIISCTLSILGSFAIFGSYIFISEIRNSTRKLVTCLTVADFISAVGYLVSGIAHFTKSQNSVCYVQSGITTYTSIVSFYLTVAIAIHIFVTVVCRNDATSSWHYLLVSNLISWIFPGIITVVAYSEKVLGRDGNSSVNTGPWCWISRENKSYIFWVFMAGKGWEFSCYLITTSLYVLSQFYKYLRHRRSTLREIQENLREEDKNYLYVWFVLYLLRIWGSVRSMMDLTHLNKDSPGSSISDALMYLQAFGDPGQAFCNSILFCLLDKTVRTYIVKLCCRKEPLHDEGSNEEQSRLVQADNNIFSNSGPEVNPSRHKSRKKPYSTGRYSSFNYSSYSRGSAEHSGLTDKVSSARLV